MKIAKLLVVAISLLVIGAVLHVAIFVASTRNEGMVSTNDLKVYAKKYLQEYKSLFDSYANELGNLSAFEFYSNYPYRVEGVISTVHGCAIFFYPSSNENIEIKTIDERIEFYLWPQMKAWWDNADTYFVIEQNTFVTFNASVWPDPIVVSPGGHIEICGTLVYQNRMVLKGSNQKKSWFPESALLDATYDFLWIARGEALSEAHLKQIEGYSLLVTKATEIERKLSNGTYGDNSRLSREHIKDETEFWDLAEEWDIKKEVARIIREEVLEQFKRTPSPYEVFLSNLPQHIANGLILFGITSLIGWGYRRSKKKRLKKRRRQSRRRPR